MGEIKGYEPEKLFFGIMYTDEAQLWEAVARLASRYGEIDCQSESYSFSGYSKYYDGEMRGEVMRKFVGFSQPVDPEELASIKIVANELEAELSAGAGRDVNLDPGLLGHGKVVFATTKGAGFRVAIGRGIYADLSLYYSQKRWNPLLWTYPDVKDAIALDFFNRARRLYLAQRAGKV